MKELKQFINGGNGEINLAVDNQKCVAMDKLEDWQLDQLTNDHEFLEPNYNRALSQIDNFVEEWMESLTPQQIFKFEKNYSLWGIPIPEIWLKVWKTIIKEPKLRDASKFRTKGNKIGSFGHLWMLWAEECIDKYLNDMEKSLLALVDCGYLYAEIGEYMVKKYGDAFWKKRKADTTTTATQMVNQYLYHKIPNKIARGELTDILKSRLKYLDRIKNNYLKYPELKEIKNKQTK